MPARRRALWVLALLALSSLASLALALAAGSIAVPLSDVFDALAGGATPHAAIVRELRLPRAVAAFAVGGLLALAGCLMQVLLRNPLADPYVLGI
ncbi:MAG: iron chelate uptake ABC transporter family permease subunit, partial [Rhodocyclaceae bacterium]